MLEVAHFFKFYFSDWKQVPKQGICSLDQWVCLCSTESTASLKHAARTQGSESNMNICVLKGLREPWKSSLCF